MKKCLLMASLAVVTASVLGMPFDTMNNNRFTNNVVRIRSENTLELLPKTQRTCLLNNIRQKNLDLVKNSLKNLSKKGIASIINQDKGKIIFSAFNEQNADIIQFLLEQEGVDVNIQDSDGNNPLHLACFYGYEKSAEFLIKKENVEINEKNAGNTLLHRTYFFMRDKIAEFLSKRKNIINEK